MILCVPVAAASTDAILRFHFLCELCGFAGTILLSQAAMIIIPFSQASKILSQSLLGGFFTFLRGGEEVLEP